jgi:hypothetical protein
MTTTPSTSLVFVVTVGVGNVNLDRDGDVNLAGVANGRPQARAPARGSAR